MKLRLLIILTLITCLSACEKTQEELLIGSWSNQDSEESIAFLADGTYHWNIPYRCADPNSLRGEYNFSGDTLIIEACAFNCITFRYFWTVDKSILELQDVENLEINSYQRNKKFSR